MPLAVRCLLLLALVAALPAARAADPLPERLSPQALQADVDVLERAYRQLHPGLLRYNTPAQLDAGFARLRESFRQPRTVPEAYLAFSRLAGQIRCGHTYANFYNQPREVAARVLEAHDRVPFHFLWIDGRMVVTRNLSTSPSLAPGTQVLAIDGIPTPHILEAMLPLARADGGNDAKRRALLQVQGDDRYESFDVYLSLLYPSIGARQRLRVLPPGATQAQEIVVDALTQADREAAHRASHAADDDATTPRWTLEQRDDGVAVLAMPTWALYDSRWDWKAWLQAAFEQMQARPPRALVIDLRGNEGGLGVGDVLLAHLVDAPLQQPGFERRTRYRTTPVALRPYLDTWDPSFHDWGRDVTDLGNGFYRLQRAGEVADGERIEPAAPRFAGPVFALVDARNSSATFEFARLLQSSGRGRLVGAPTGGNRRGINGGAFFFLRLPNSRIELDLPLVGQFPTTPQPDAGLEPDLPAPVTVADVAAGVDPSLRAVLRALDAADGT